MPMFFELTDATIDPQRYRPKLMDSGAGGYVSFEGWVRDRNDGQIVTALAYEAYPELAQHEAQRILSEAYAQFPIHAIACVHRTGYLQIGELAVWIGVSATHRQSAFQACEYAIDQLKVRLPIWKKEYYQNGHSHWVHCSHCAAKAPSSN
jgi:molybdopterin synthase catalytic subunit